MSDSQISGLVASLDPEINLESLVRQLKETGWIEDIEYLDSAAEAALENSQSGFEPPAIPGSGESEKVLRAAIGNFPDFSRIESLENEALLTKTVMLLEECRRIGASDLHLSAGGRPRIRRHKKIIYLSAEPLSDSSARRMSLSLLDESQSRAFEENGDLEYALSLGNLVEGCSTRVRTQLMEQKNGIAASYRIIPETTPSLEELGFPNAKIIRKLLDYHNGIILLTGPSGCGKSTTLASLVSELNGRRREHIITIEDPIEFIQESEKSIVTQRQIGKHTESFHSALHSALREDPDIIIIGEIRDLETVEMAVTAAETGHLVIATMHTEDATTTLHRLLDGFPHIQQNQIRSMMAGSLRGIVCQKLIPTTDDGITLACELLLNTPAVANIIRDGKETGLENAMQTGSAYGMLTMQDSLKALLAEGRITEETARTCLGQSHADVMI